MKRVILAMSYNKHDVAGWIENHAYPTMKVLAQLYLFPDASTKNHWRGEAWAAFHSMRTLKRMRTLKPKHKLPSAEFIYANSWIPNSQFADTAIKMMLEKENTLVPRVNHSVSIYSELADKYFWWISQMLSTVPEVSKAEVYNKLEELGL